jgi:hypothetical protein
VTRVETSTAGRRDVSPGSSEGRWQKKGRWLRVAIFLAALGYFCAGLDSLEPSLLESQDFGIACDLWKSLGMTPDHSPLHFLFLNAWQHVSASSFALMRFPSALCCAVAALAVFAVAELEAGPLAGALAAVFLTLNPLVVDNARSIRMYSWVVLLSALCVCFAYKYLCRGRQVSDLKRFAICSVLAIYNHLFGWLLFGSLGLLIAVDVFQHSRSVPAAFRQRTRVAFMTAAALAPQLIHAFVAVAYTHERHERYRGISGSFTRSVAETLFLGEQASGSSIPALALVLPLALVVLGIASARRRGLIASAAIFPLGLLVAWFLSLTSEVEARYLNYLAPVLAIFMGIAIVKLPKGYLAAPLALAVAGLFVFATHQHYDVPPTDWYDAAQRIQESRRPGDVVAVFPGYWTWTFQRYSKLGELVPITYPVDLERALSRGKRVILVSNRGRFFGHIAAFLAKRGRSRQLFSTRVREQLDVYAIAPDRHEPMHIEDVNEPALVLAGLVGSGGYPWQSQPDAARAFARLNTLFNSAAAVVTGYEAYAPPWYQRLVWGSRQFRALEPNAEVTRAMKVAGIGAVASRCAAAGCRLARDALAANGVATLPAFGSSKSALSRVYEIGPARVGIVSLERGALIAPLSAASDRAHASVATAIVRAKAALGPEGHLVVLVDQRADYGRLPEPNERLVAHALIDLGAEVVAGIGGYAAKEIESYGAGVIAYSLGTLLRPSMLSLAARDSTGIALRVVFARDRRPSFQVFPISFDDESHPALDRRELVVEHLVRDAEPRLDARFASAAVSCEGRDGQLQPLGEWHAHLGSVGSALERRLIDWIEPAAAWFPVAPKSTTLIPLYGGYALGGSYAAMRGVSSLGEYRRAIELESAGRPRLRVTFGKVLLGDRLRLNYALPDDRLGSKSIALADQEIVLEIPGAASVRSPVPYLAGWRSVSVDTSAVSSTPNSVTVELQTHGMHFPVAFDLSIERNHSLTSEVRSAGRPRDSKRL